MTDFDQELEALHKLAEEKRRALAEPSDEPAPIAQHPSVTGMLARRTLPEGGLLIAQAAARAERELAEERRIELRRLLAHELPGGYRFARFGAGREEWLRQPPFSDRPRAVSKCRAIGAMQKTPSVVWAGSGSEGKTSLAVATAALWAFTHPGQSLCFVSALKLAMARAQAPLGSGEPEIVERARRADLLIVDDLGTERDITLSAVPDVIHERHLEGLALWVTTWCTRAQLESRYGDGIARRVLERSIVVTWADG